MISYGSLAGGGAAATAAEAPNGVSSVNSSQQQQQQQASGGEMKRRRSAAVFLWLVAVPLLLLIVLATTLPTNHETKWRGGSGVGTTIHEDAHGEKPSVTNDREKSPPDGSVSATSSYEDTLSISETTSETLSSDASSTATATSDEAVASTPPTIPYPSVDRNDYGDPVFNILRKELFADHLLVPDETENVEGANGKMNKSTFIFPFPTGAFWVNLVLPPTADRQISYPIACYPYAYKWNPNFLQLSYPAHHRRQDRLSVHDYFFPDMTIGSAPPNGEYTQMAAPVHKRQIESFDPLSVTVRFDINEASTNALASYFQSYLVQGSPFATVVYHNAKPHIKALSTFIDIVCIQGESSVCKEEVTDKSVNKPQGIKSVTGDRFVLHTSEGVDWLLVTSVVTTWEFDTRIRTTIQSTRATRTTSFFKYMTQPTDEDDLIIRLAYLSSQVTSSSPHSSTGFEKLLQYAPVYPVGSAVDWSFAGRPDERIGTVHFNFDTKRFDEREATDDGDKDDSLLMLSLPHHAQLLPKQMLLGGLSNGTESNDDFDLSFESIKGHMTPVVGKTWAYGEPLLNDDMSFGINAATSDKHDLLQDVEARKLLLQHLEEDVTFALPVWNENIYGFGKEAARLAQLAWIASELSSLDSSGQRETLLLQKTLSTLEDALVSVLRRENRDTLVYDVNLGGIVTTDGLIDSHADFGNGRYNDHHFHYGYLLHASAVLGQLKPSFVEEYGDAVDALWCDVSYNFNIQSSQKPPEVAAFFPGARHKLWFDGHSFASGLFPFGNGKSQESSSESVNCYYGAYLWSRVRNGASSSRTDFAALLLAMEIRGTQMYWQMMPSYEPKAEGVVSVYDSDFAKNYMVGNVGMLDLVCTTWFGTNPLYVHLINFLPVTAATAALFKKAYAKAEYDHVLAKMKEVDESWRGYAVAHHAISDPNLAWTDAQELDSHTMDSGLSKTQLLLWIMTRPGFSLEMIQGGAGDDEHDASSLVSPAACSSNPGCASLNLMGDCCPTTQGKLLGCCQLSSPESQTSKSEAPISAGSSSCSSHTLCVASNLTGECCPTASGIMLDCCS